MNDLDLRMSRQGLEAIAFWQVEYNAWKAAPLSAQKPAKLVESVPIDRAEQMFKGNQLEMAISHSEIQELFEFFKKIDDGSRYFYMNGLLKHPSFQQQQPAFFVPFIEGAGLRDQELDIFLAQFGASIYTLQNRNESHGNSLDVSWGLPIWLPDEMKDELDPDRTLIRLPDKSYVKWRGKDLLRSR